MCDLSIVGLGAILVIEALSFEFAHIGPMNYRRASELEKEDWKPLLVSSDMPRE